LGKARDVKNDEFYTRFDDIQAELNFYKDQLKDKVIYCNCDDHERPDRQERDREVERILINAGVPFLRLKNRGTFRTEEIAERIKQAISGVPVSLV